MNTVFIGLGSNLQNPSQQLSHAIEKIRSHPQLRLLQSSSFYQSKALTLDNRPQPDYINAVVKIETALEAEHLLDVLQQIETHQGRVRVEKWGARTLDLDILLFADHVFCHERLTVPHPHMSERNFVIVPLYEIDPSLEIPNIGKLSTIMENLSKEGLTQLA